MVRRPLRPVNELFLRKLAGELSEIKEYSIHKDMYFFKERILSNEIHYE